MKWFIILLLLIGTAQAQNYTVGVERDFGFWSVRPPTTYINHTLSIQVNDTITWINDGNSRLFLSGTKWNTSLASDYQYTKTFNKSGTYKIRMTSNPSINETGDKLIYSNAKYQTIIVGKQEQIINIEPTRTPRPPREPEYEETFVMPTQTPVPVVEHPFTLIEFIKLIIGI